MRRRGPRPTRFDLTYDRAIDADISALGPEERHAARKILDDLARGAATGKALGERRVSGDLTGFLRFKFDIPGRHPQKLRLVYRFTGPTTAEVFAIGRRGDHEIYRLAADRLDREL